MDESQINDFFEPQDQNQQLKYQPFYRRQSQISNSQQLFPSIPHQPNQQMRFENDNASEEDNESVDQAFKKVILFHINVSNHPYARAHHYFCELDRFERDPDSVSYARDPSKTMKSTFSKDDLVVGGSKIKEIINRIYFTHPLKEDSSDRKPSKAKNSSHQGLFDTQDKKLWFDKMIYTIRQVINNLEQLISTNKIDQYFLLKKDQFLHKIFDPSVPISDKRMILISRLQGLIESRRLSEYLWIAQQTINYAPSCNQQFYEKYNTKLNFFSRRVLVPILYSDYYYLMELIKQPTKDKLFNFNKNAFTFSREQALSVSLQTLVKLSTDFKDKISSKVDNQSAVIFPIQIFSFGDEKAMKIVNRILAKRLTLYQTQFYAMNLIMRKMFNKSLSVPEDDGYYEDEDTFKLQASTYIAKIREYVKSSVCEAVANNPLIDDQINYQDLTSQQQPAFVLKRREPIQLSGEEFIILMHYHWLCLIVKQMAPFIDQNPQFLQIISSCNFKSISISVGQAFKSMLVSTLNDCIQEIRSNLSSPSQLNFDGFKIQFDYNQSNCVGTLWRIKSGAIDNSSVDQDCQNYNEQKKDSQNEQDYDVLHFGKRVKSLEGQWV